MKVQLHTDNHIQGDEALAQRVEQIVVDALGRFNGQVGRVEVHVSDVNGGKSGSRDKHCTMEARVDGLPPMAASAEAESVALALTGAAKKLERVLDSSLGKLAR